MHELGVMEATGMKIEKINTQRLYLRGFEKTDVGFAMSVWNDPEMGEYLPDPSMENMDEEYRKSLESLGDDETCCYLISESKKTGDRIGTCSFIPSKDGVTYDIAYCVHKKYWRNGYATEMVKGLIEYAKQCSAEKITVVVNKENTASNAIVKKLGFKIVGENSYKKSGTNIEFSDYKYELELIVEDNSNEEKTCMKEC